MTVTVTGFVAKIFERSGTSNGRDWTAYSAKIQDAKTGDELPLYYQFGFDKPNLKEGDYVQFKAEPKDDKAAQADPATVKHGKNPPARPETKKQESKGGGKKGGWGGGGAKVTKSELFGDIGGYNTEDDIRRMSLSNSRDAAVATVTALLEHDALPMSAAKNKGGQAKRYDEILSQIDKLTVKFFFDAATGRVLEHVSDEGTVDTSAKGELPEDSDDDGFEEPEQPVPGDEDDGFESEDDDDEFE